MDLRLRAIFCCFYFGLVPWWVYENKRHYNTSYFRHLKLNLYQIKVWLYKKETKEDIIFELETNTTWKKVLLNLFK